VTKFAGVEELSLRKRLHGQVESWSILIHFPPLLTTFHARVSIKN
jgi:hypothetical protein